MLINAKSAVTHGLYFDHFGNLKLPFETMILRF